MQEKTDIRTPVQPANWDYLRVDDAATRKRIDNVFARYAEHGNLVSRALIKDIYRGDIAEGVIATIVWGYPKGRYPGGRGFNPMLDQIDEIVAILRTGHERSGDIDAAELCYRFSRISGIGISTYSKMLYFAEVEAKEGLCLIYDQMVMRAISVSPEPELAPLQARLGSSYLSSKGSAPSYRTYPPALQEATYGLFLDAAGRMATRKGMHPADVEQELFLEAPKGSIAEQDGK